MNFSCNKCQRRYSIADEKVRGKTVKVRCKNCQNVISVEGPPAETEESTRVVSLADVERLREQDRSLAEEDASVAPVASQSWEDEPTRTMPVREGRSPWFVMVKGKQEGPLDDLALRELLAAGTLSARSHFWQQGMADWKRGQDIEELADLFVPAVAAPPPAARPAPPPVMASEPEPEPERTPEPEPERTPEPRRASGVKRAPEPTGASATSWEAEARPPSQTTWQTGPTQKSPTVSSVPAPTPWEPEPEPGESTPLPRTTSSSEQAAAPLGELFSDLDLPAEQQAEAQAGDGALAEPQEAPEKKPKKQRSNAENASAQKRGGGSPAPKIALVLVLLVLLPVIVLFALTEMQVVPLRALRTDAAGNTTLQSVSLFSPEGFNALKDMLVGNPAPVAPAPRPAPAPQKPPEPEKPPAAQGETAPQGEAAPPAVAPATGETAPAGEAAPAAGDSQGTAPQGEAVPAGEPAPLGAVGKSAEPEAASAESLAGPSAAEVARVLEKSQTTFQPCIDQVLRRSPKLRDSTLLLTTTVVSSGAVKKVAFDLKEIETSPAAECFKGRARRLVFSAFPRESFEVEIPLVLTREL